MTEDVENAIKALVTRSANDVAATIAAGTSGAFFKTSPRLASPDIQIHFLPFSTDKMGEKLHALSGFTASVCQLRPESRGSGMIRSAEPADHPAIVANYLAAETDLAALGALVVPWGQVPGAGT